MAVALVTGNNLSACVGTAVGARILSGRTARMLGAAGIACGLLFQGRAMLHTTQTLLPVASDVLVSELLFVTIAVFLIAKALRAPLSLSMSLVALVLGVAVHRQLPADYGYAFRVIAMWAVAPVAAVAFGFFFLRAVGLARPRDVWRRIVAYKVLLVLCSLLAAWVLGANTVGLIVALGGFDLWAVLVALLAVVSGCLWLSGGEIRRVGEDLFSLRYTNALASLLVSTVLVEFATLLGIPLSSTQALSASVLGAGASYRHKLINLRPFLTIIAAWIAVPTLAFAVGCIL